MVTGRWTVKEYADRMRLSTKTVYRMIEEKKLSVERVGERKWLILEDVEAEQVVEKVEEVKEGEERDLDRAIALETKRSKEIELRRLNLMNERGNAELAGGFVTVEEVARFREDMERYSAGKEKLERDGIVLQAQAEALAQEREQLVADAAELARQQKEWGKEFKRRETALLVQERGVAAREKKVKATEEGTRNLVAGHNYVVLLVEKFLNSNDPAERKSYYTDILSWRDKDVKEWGKISVGRVGPFRELGSILRERGADNDG